MEGEYLGDPALAAWPETGIFTGRKNHQIRNIKARWWTSSQRSTQRKQGGTQGMLGDCGTGRGRRKLDDKKSGEGEKHSDKGNAEGTWENSDPTALLGKSLLHEVPQTGLPLGSPSFWDNAVRATTNNNNYIILIHARRFLLISVQIVIFDSSKSIHWIFLYFSTKTVVAPTS